MTCCLSSRTNKKLKFHSLQTCWMFLNVCHYKKILIIKEDRPPTCEGMTLVSWRHWNKQKCTDTYGQIYAKIPHRRFGFPLQKYQYYCTKPQQKNTTEYLRSSFPHTHTHTETQTQWITPAFYDETNASNLFQKPNESFSTSKPIWLSTPPTTWA